MVNLSSTGSVKKSDEVMGVQQLRMSHVAAWRSLPEGNAECFVLARMAMVAHCGLTSGSNVRDGKTGLPT